MTLRCDLLEKALRERVKSYDAARQMSWWERLLRTPIMNSEPPMLFFGIFISGIGALLLFLARQAVVKNPDGALAVANAWAFFLSLLNATVFRGVEDRTHRQRATALQQTLWMLPLPADHIFNYLLRQALLAAVFFFFQFLLLYGLIATVSAQAVVAALLQAAVIAGATLLFVNATSAKRAASIVFGTLFLCGLISLFPPSWPLLINFLYFSNPSGWVNYLFITGGVRHAFEAFWLALPLLAFFAVLPFILRAARRAFQRAGIRPPPLLRPADQIVLIGFRPAAPKTVDPELQRQALLSGGILCPPQFPSWSLAGLVSRRFNPRERLIFAACAVGDFPWKKAFPRFLFFFGLLAAANSQIQEKSFLQIFYAYRQSPYLRAGPWLVALLCSYALCFCVPALFFWGGRLPSGLLPVSAWERVKVLVKTASIVAVVLFPFALVATWFPFLNVFSPRLPGLLFPPNWLLAAWCFSVLVRSTSLLPTGWFWTELFPPIALLPLGVFFCAWGASHSVWSEMCLGLGGVALTLLWLLFWGARYNRKSIRWAAGDFLFDKSTLR